MTKALHFLLCPQEIFFMKPRKPAITLSADKQALSIQKLRAELQDRFELKLGSFEAKELLDWFMPRSACCITTRPSPTHRRHCPGGWS